MILPLMETGLANGRVGIIGAIRRYAAWEFPIDVAKKRLSAQRVNRVFPLTLTVQVYAFYSPGGPAHQNHSRGCPVQADVPSARGLRVMAWKLRVFAVIVGLGMVPRLPKGEST
jgi:hypothetical protein